MSKKQLNLNLYRGKRGGRRPGSGRKRLNSKGVAHRKRDKVELKTPMHINFKYNTYIRTKDCLKLLKKAIVNSRAMGLKVIHFSMQTNHVHLIIEAENNKILTKGMRSLTITFAKGLRRGRVQLERYHLHVLRTLRESRNAIHYVLFNQQRHDKKIVSVIDEYSSIMLLRNAIELIRHYTVTKNVTLKIEKSDDFKLDQEISYFLRKGLVPKR